MHWLTQIFVAIPIRLQLVIDTTPLNKIVFFRPILSTMSWLIIGPNMCPMAVMATRVEMLETVTEIGESGAISLTMLGESQPIIAPMHKDIIEPRFRIIASPNCKPDVIRSIEREIAW